MPSKLPLPQWIPPQLTQLVETAPSGAKWIHEIKLDGFRMAARIEHGQAKLLTRTGLDWSAKYQACLRRLRPCVRRPPISTANCAASAKTASPTSPRPRPRPMGGARRAPGVLRLRPPAPRRGRNKAHNPSLSFRTSATAPRSTLLPRRLWPDRAGQFSGGAHGLNEFQIAHLPVDSQ
jgi:hypothetical protein